MPKKKRPTEAVVKALFARSKNQCAMPDCLEPNVTGDKVLAEICHIKGERPDAARYDAQQSDAERRSYDNLILLCPNHHTEIDKDEAAYPVSLLHEIKKSHESATPDQAHAPHDRVIARIAHDLDIVRQTNHNSPITAHNQTGGQIAHQITNIVQSPVENAAAPWRPLPLGLKADPEEAKARIRARIQTTFERFVPLGLDHEIDLESIYRDLALYRRFESPYYKSRDDLMRELDIERSAVFYSMVVDSLRQAFPANARRLRAALSVTGKSPEKSIDARRDAVNKLMTAPGLIDDLRRLEGEEDLARLLVSRVTRDILRSLLITLGYHQGSLGAVTNHIRLLVAEDYQGLLSRHSDFIKQHRPRGRQDRNALDEAETRRLLTLRTENRRRDQMPQTEEMQAVRFSEDVQKTAIDRVFLLMESAVHEGRLKRDLLGLRGEIYGEIAKYEAQRETVSVADALQAWHHIVVLGHPGSGKSTLLRHTALVCARDDQEMPFYIRLRDLSDTRSLWQLLLSEVAEFGTSSELELGRALEAGEACLLLDGFDEVRESYKPLARLCQVSGAARSGCIV